jgi:hypothetical protein
MGAIERNGYIFEPEYSVTYQKGAIHVYFRGTFVEEIPFTFSGIKPSDEQIELLIDEYFQKRR